MTANEKISASSGFTKVSVEEFDDNNKNSREQETNLVVLTAKEQELVNSVFVRLKAVSPETLVVLEDRLADLEKLTANIAHFPSLKQTQEHGSSVRDMHTLVESLLIRRNGDRMLHLPSKAILGRGFSVAKFHTFSAMEKIAASSEFPDTIAIDIRQKIASELIMLWEHRSDETVIEMAPVLSTVWNARRNLAPAFGTMVGTSELLLLSMAMDDQWCHFISSRMGNEDAALAME